MQEPKPYVLNQPAGRTIDFKRELNEQQFAAVTATPGPMLVIAGAGSGKTRTLIYRVAYLIENGIEPGNILLLTFTNKAAREMVKRVADIVPQDTSSLMGGTFHHVANRILRKHAELLGFTSSFTIMDREDSKDLINACISELKIDTKKKRFPKGDLLAEVFSLSVNTEKSLQQILDDQFSYLDDAKQQIISLYPLYQKRKKSSNSMDYDDLLLNMLKLLQDFPEVRDRYQKRFQFILVDEYQDTNKIQSDLIDILAAAHKNVLVVGDDAQSIYSWRGANYENIFKFPDRYKGTRIYKIEVNYRSTPEILKLANHVIGQNSRQFSKELTATRASSGKPILVPCPHNGRQAQFVAQRILELRDEGHSLNECAVLYRSHFHAMELQMEFTRRQIPFQITSGLKFFEQAHVKDVAAFLKVMLNPRDEVAFRRVIKLLPSVGEKTADKVWNKVSATPIPFTDGVHSDYPLFWGKLGSSTPDFVPAKATAFWKQFTALMADMSMPNMQSNIPELVRLVVESLYDDYLKKQFSNYQSRLEDLNQLAAFSRNFETVDDFLMQLSLVAGDESGGTKPDQDEDRVRLSTVHQAKGLEWQTVFIIGLADGMFPSQKAIESSADSEEEERRLFYVAVTRARDQLYLSYPIMRENAAYTDFIQKPSRFLDLPKELVEEWRLANSFEMDNPW